MNYARLREKNRRVLEELIPRERKYTLFALKLIFLLSSSSNAMCVLANILNIHPQSWATARPGSIAYLVYGLQQYLVSPYYCTPRAKTNSALGDIFTCFVSGE